jgi:hypothetical protein
MGYDDEDEEDRPRDTPARREALLEAKVRSLRDTLAEYGVLEADRLEELSGAGAWEPGGFEQALSAAVQRGVIHRRGDDFYELPLEGG